MYSSLRLDFLIGNHRNQLSSGYGGKVRWTFSATIHTLDRWYSFMNKTILLDLSGIIDEETFHEYVSKKLNFPAHYGYNFDAFWDCISDSDYLDSKTELRVEGLSEFRKNLPNAYPKFMSCIEDYKSEFPKRLIQTIEDSPSGEGIVFEIDI